MGIAQKKSKSAKRGQQSVRGWSLNGWHALFFLAGIILACAGQLVFSSMHRGGSGEVGSSLVSTKGAASASGARNAAAAKPWGDLVITPLVLDRPDEMFEIKDTLVPPIRWCFPNHSPAQLAGFIRSCDLTDAQKASLLDTNRWQPGTNGWRIWPALEVVRDLSEPARERIYSVLAQSSENPQCFPFTCREERFDEMFAGCDLAPDKVALVRRLCYRKRGLLYFADGQLFELITTSNETRCLFKTLLRVPTMLVKLRLTPDSDIEALVKYWDSGGRAKDLKPLLQSLARTPDGGSLNISFFLPPVPRLRLYTYPQPTNGLPQDCFWTSFNFFGERPGYRLGDVAYADQLLRSDYTRVQGEKKFGDVLVLTESNYAVHACVFIADDVYYTKNGTDPNQPWVLMRMKDMMTQYASGQPQEWKVYRRKST
jgi:hypothetical protein